MSYSYHTEQFQNDDITFAAWLRPHFKHGKGNSSCMVKATIAAWWRQHFLLGEGNIHIPCLVKGTFLAWWRQYSPPPCMLKGTFPVSWSQHFLHCEVNISCMLKGTFPVSWSHGRQENFWTPGQKETWPPLPILQIMILKLRLPRCVISKQSVQQKWINELWFRK